MPATLNAAARECVDAIDRTFGGVFRFALGLTQLFQLCCNLARALCQHRRFR